MNTISYIIAVDITAAIIITIIGFLIACAIKNLHENMDATVEAIRSATTNLVEIQKNFEEIEMMLKQQKMR